MRLLVVLAIVLRTSTPSACSVAVDPGNESGCASDENNGAKACGKKGVGPVRSNKRAMALFEACMANS